MEAIRTTGLTKKYKDLTAVDGLNLSVMQGELFALLGVNGAGKSTTIRLLCTLAQPTEGDAFLMGHSIRTQSAQVKQLIGVSPQETAVAPSLTVQENLELICGVHGFDRAAARQKVASLMEEFGLTGMCSRRAGKLSGGWQRRLSIAMALICEPKILFLDEPTLGLDVIARSELWDTIRALKGKMTIILTTHDMEEAEALSDRIGVMKAGRLLTVAAPAELMAQTGTKRVEDAFIKLVREVE